MKTNYLVIDKAVISAAATRRSWLGRLATLVGGGLLGLPALARAARRGPTQGAGSEPLIGEIMLCAFGFTPKGFLPCNGQVLPINQNQALYSLLGTTYGGNGTTNFNLPDMRGRVLRGIDNSGAYQLGQVGGTATLAPSVVAPHTHQARVSSLAATTSSPDGAVAAVAAGTNLNGENVAVLAYGSPDTNVATTSTTGSAPTISTVAPYLGLQYCIAVQGLFPSRN